jgi:hypothetical protein
MIIYRHNTGKQIDQLAFRVNLVEALFHQFADTERKVPGHRAGDNTIPRLREHFIHKVPPSGKKISSAEMCGMHQAWMEERNEILLSAV